MPGAPQNFWSKFTSDIRKTLFVRKICRKKNYFFWGGDDVRGSRPPNFLVIFGIGRWKKNNFGAKKNFFGGGSTLGVPPPAGKKNFGCRNSFFR